MAKRALNIAIIGMGGFAKQHHRAVHALEQEGECRLIGACDPDPGAFADDMARWEFESRDVRVFTDYRDLLAACGGELEVVTIPTPIPLHAPMHRACVDRGLVCYLEKPPTLDAAELDAMVATDAPALKSTAVGFLMVSDSERRALKRRLASGEFGRVQRASMIGLMHRSTFYYTRNDWAARLLLNGQLVVDSCIGNAMAHILHNLLLWAGQCDELTWADVECVEAELYHAHDIESADTVFARGRCTNGVEVRLAATHACDIAGPVTETVECEGATITWGSPAGWQVTWRDGRVETGSPAPGDLLTECIRHQLRYARGEEARPLSRLPDTRPFVTFHDLAFVAAGHVTAVGPAHLKRSQSPFPGDGIFVAIDDIRQACETMRDTGRLPSEQGLPWARPGGAAGIDRLPEFRATIERMAAKA